MQVVYSPAVFRVARDQHIKCSSQVVVQFLGYYRFPSFGITANSPRLSLRLLQFKAFLQCAFDHREYYEPFLEMLGGMPDDEGNGGSPG